MYSGIAILDILVMVTLIDMHQNLHRSSRHLQRQVLVWIKAGEVLRMSQDGSNTQFT